MVSATECIRFQVQGSGPAVLVLPGCPCKPEHYASLASRLSSRFQVIVAELPGYEGFCLGNAGGIQDVSQGIQEKLLRLGVRQLSVVGHSLGGYRALHLALSTVLEITTVVTLGGFADLGEAKRIYLELADIAEQSTAQLADAFMPNACPSGFAKTHPPRAAAVRGYVADMHGPTLAAQLRVLAHLDDLRPRLSGLRAAVVAIHGAADLVIPPVRSAELVASVPNGRLESFSGVGHFPLCEAEDRTLAAIERGLGVTERFTPTKLD